MLSQMKEINKAYDMLTKNKTNTGYSGASYSGGGAYSETGSYAGAAPSFDMVRRLISMGVYSQAAAMLQSLPQTAEWYYLSGLINLRRGWTTQGIEYLRKACEMDPDNVEYRDQLRYNETNAGTYTNDRGGYSASGACCPMPCWCIPCVCPGCCCNC